MWKLLIPFLLISHAVYAQFSDQKPEGFIPFASDSSWRTIDDSDYVVQYPGKWELKKGGKLAVNFIVFSPAESNEDDFKENVNLIIQDLTNEDLDLDKFTELSEGQIKTMITNSELLESQRILDSSGGHHKLIYSGNRGEQRMVYEQYYWVKNNRAFILTLTAQSDKYGKFKEVGERIMNSFRLKK